MKYSSTRRVFRCDYELEFIRYANEYHFVLVSLNAFHLEKNHLFQKEDIIFYEISD